MNQHPYLRACMAGISSPTPFLLVVLPLFGLARFMYNVPIPVERIIIFPMAIIRICGGSGICFTSLRALTRTCRSGIHGAILPLILAPPGFLLGRGLNFLQFTGHSFVYFGILNIHFAHIAIAFPVAVITYYLVCKIW